MKDGLELLLDTNFVYEHFRVNLRMLDCAVDSIGGHVAELQFIQDFNEQIVEASPVLTMLIVHDFRIEEVNEAEFVTLLNHFHQVFHVFVIEDSYVLTVSEDITGLYLLFTLLIIFICCNTQWVEQRAQA